MKVLYKWENCFRFEPEIDAFYLEVPKNEISEELLNLVVKGNDGLILDDEYFDDVNRFAKDKITRGLANKDCVYFLVDKDVKKIILCKAVYPYSGMWNDSCPFKYLYKTDFNVDEYLKNAIEINKLEDLKYIDKIIDEKLMIYCNVHKCKMIKKNIPILYGMPLPPPVGYLENKEIFFPNCDDEIIGGCVIENNSPKYLKKYYCKQCNRDRDKWKTFLDSFNYKNAPTPLNKR